MKFRPTRRFKKRK